MKRCFLSLIYSKGEEKASEMSLIRVGIPNSLEQNTWPWRQEDTRLATKNLDNCWKSMSLYSNSTRLMTLPKLAKIKENCLQQSHIQPFENFLIRPFRPFRSRSSALFCYQGTWNLPCTYFRCAFLRSTLLAWHLFLVGWRWEVWRPGVLQMGDLDPLRGAPGGWGNPCKLGIKCC